MACPYNQRQHRNHTPWSRRFTFGTVSLAILLMMVAGIDSGFEPAAACARQEDELAITEGGWLSLNFGGGTAADYIEAIRSASKSANIVVMPGAEHVLMPPVQLKAVTLLSALKLLDHLQSVDENGRRYILRFDQIESNWFDLTDDDRRREGVDSPTTLPVFVVNVDSAPAPWGKQDQSAVEPQVWDIESLVQALSADDVLATIDVALPLATEDEPNVEIRFHEETGILIARGEAMALRMIDEVLNHLEGTAQARGAADERARRVDELESVLEERRKHAEEVAAQREQLAQEAEQMQVRMRELREVVDQLRVELDGRSAVISELRSRILQLETALGRKNDKE